MGKEDGDKEGDGVIYEACADCCRVCRSTHGEGMPRSSSMPRFFKTLTEYSTAPSPICSLQIPASYIRNHIGVSKKKKFVLDAAPGCEWPVTFHSVAFEAGWREFAVDYELEKGDGIMFSLVDRRRFHVNVFDKFGMEKVSTKQRASPTHSTSIGAEDRCRARGLLQLMPNGNNGHNEPAGDETEPSTTSYSSEDTEDSLQVRLAKAILAKTRRRKLKEMRTSCTRAALAAVGKTTTREAAACKMLQDEGKSNEGQIDSPASGDEAMFEIPTEEGARVPLDNTRLTVIIEATNVTRNGDVQEDEAPHIAQTMETGDGVELSKGAEAEAEDLRPSPVFSAGTVKLEPNLGPHQPCVKCAHCGLRRDLPPAKREPVTTTENQEATNLGGVKTSEARGYPRSTALPATENQKQRALAAAKELSISLKNPNALVVMRTSMPDTSYDCFLSVKCSEMLPSVPTELILMDPEGVARRINWNGQRYMSGPGWIDFVDSHNLQVADVWVMEVIDRSEHSFVVKAHILHAHKMESLSEVKPPTPVAVIAPVSTAPKTLAAVTAPVSALKTPAVVTGPVATAPTTPTVLPALIPVLGTPAPLLVSTGARTRSSHTPVSLAPSKSRKRTRTLKQLDESVEIPKPPFQFPKPSSEVPSLFKIRRPCAINTTEDDRASMEPTKRTPSKRPRRGSFTSSPSTLGTRGRDPTPTSLIGEEPSQQKKELAAKSSAQGEVKKSKGTRRRHSLYTPHVHRKDKSEDAVAASQSASKVQLRSSTTDESPENLKQVRTRNSQRPHYKVAKMIDRRRSLGGVVFLVELSERVSTPRNIKRLKAQQDEKGRWWVPHNHFSKDFTSCYIE